MINPSKNILVNIIRYRKKMENTLSLGKKLLIKVSINNHLYSPKLFNIIKTHSIFTSCNNSNLKHPKKKWRKKFAVFVFNLDSDSEAGILMLLNHYDHFQQVFRDQKISQTAIACFNFGISFEITTVGRRKHVVCKFS